MVADVNTCAGKAVLRQMTNDVQATLLLPRYAANPGFMQGLSSLQAFQSARMRCTHQNWYLNFADGNLLDFIVDEVYRGIDLTPLKGKLASAERVLGTLFDDFELVQVAVSFTAITSSLDDELTRILMSMRCAVIDDVAYANAVRQQNRLIERKQQGELLLSFTRLLLGLLHDRNAWHVIKLAKLPTHLAGLGSFHNLVTHGFAALCDVEEAGDKVERLVADEAAYFDALQRQ